MTASRQAILVNGVPASGKSTVARAISGAFSWPLLTVDAIKEPFFEHLGVGDREYNRKLGRGSYAAIFNLIADFPPGSTTVVDAWFGFQPVDVLTSHLARAGVRDVVEIWCHTDASTIVNRYRGRVGTRPAGHPGLDYLPELQDLVGRAKPLGIFPRLDIETSGPFDLQTVASWISNHLRTG